MATRVRPKPEELYDRDFYVWTERQAGLLRARRFQELDLYRPSDLETAEFLERGPGAKIRLRAFPERRGGGSHLRGAFRAGCALMTAQAIKQMGDEDIIVFHRRMPPFRAKRMDWRHFRELKARQRWPAPALPTLPELNRIPSPLGRDTGLWHPHISVRTRYVGTALKNTPYQRDDGEQKLTDCPI